MAPGAQGMYSPSQSPENPSPVSNYYCRGYQSLKNFDQQEILENFRKNRASVNQ